VPTSRSSPHYPKMWVSCLAFLGVTLHLLLDTNRHENKNDGQMSEMVILVMGMSFQDWVSQLYLEGIPLFVNNFSISHQTYSDKSFSEIIIERTKIFQFVGFEAFELSSPEISL